MPRTYTTTLSMSIGGDEPTWEGEATVSFAVAWGRPAMGPTYSHGGLPADPDEVSDVRVTHIDGQPIAQREYGQFEAASLEDVIDNSDELLSELIIKAADQKLAERSDYLERRADELRAEWGMQ